MNDLSFEFLKLILFIFFLIAIFKSFNSFLSKMIFLILSVFIYPIIEINFKFLRYIDIYNIILILLIILVYTILQAEIVRKLVLRDNKVIDSKYKYWNFLNLYFKSHSKNSLIIKLKNIKSNDCLFSLKEIIKWHNIKSYKYNKLKNISHYNYTFKKKFIIYFKKNFYKSNRILIKNKNKVALSILNDFDNYKEYNFDYSDIKNIKKIRKILFDNSKLYEYLYSYETNNLLKLPKIEWFRQLSFFIALIAIIVSISQITEIYFFGIGNLIFVGIMIGLNIIETLFTFSKLVESELDYYLLLEKVINNK